MAERLSVEYSCFKGFFHYPHTPTHLRNRVPRHPGAPTVAFFEHRAAGGRFLGGCRSGMRQAPKAADPEAGRCHGSDYRRRSAAAAAVSVCPRATLAGAMSRWRSSPFYPTACAHDCEVPCGVARPASSRQPAWAPRRSRARRGLSYRTPERCRSGGRSYR